MFTVLTCVRDQHDARLLVAALVICILSTGTGLSIYARAVLARSSGRIGWSTLAGFVTGCGVWATHFLSMLAYRANLSIAYAPVLTALSLAAAIVILSCGFLVAARSRRTTGRVVGGFIVGAGVAAMHLIGVAAMTGPTIIDRDFGLLAGALVIGLGGGALAMGLLGAGSSVRRLSIGAGVLTLSICGLHLTAMAAVTLVPGPAQAARDIISLGIAVTGVVGLVLIAAVGILTIARLSSRATLLGMKSALDEAPTAIGFFDAQRRLTFWNRAYADLSSVFGVTPAAGMRFDVILEAVTAGCASHHVTSGLARTAAFRWGGPPDELELPDGRIIQASVGPTQDGGMIAVLVDVTQTRQAENLANEGRDRAEAANRSKSEFLANMSHEIRTPLNGVLGMAHVMEGHPLEPAQRERLAVIVDSGECLLKLLNDILDLSKMESGQVALQEIEFDLETAMRPTFETFAVAAALKHLSFEATVTRAASGQWTGDPVRLRQLVSNLIANAVKFTANGTISVLFDATSNGLRVIVRDTGIGIKAEQIPMLFEKFTQADSTSTRKFGGTGLGLAICRDLAELMGGELGVDAVEGAGSVFTFEAPLSRPLDEPAHALFVQEPCGRLRVLAAEDNAVNQMVMKAMLEPLGVDLVMAADGEEALAAYRKRDFDLILMDIQMPKLGGVEATNAIRRWEADHGARRTPILAVTANVMTHQIGAYLAAGMDGIIAKPIEISKLFSSIQNVLLPLEQAA